jgi:hypothetical protein
MKSATARRIRGSAIQNPDQVGTGSKPLASLCSPWAPGSKRLQAVADAVLDALVITKFEVQAGCFDFRAPMTAVKGFGVAIADGRCHRSIALEGEKDHHLPAQRRATCGKNSTGKAGWLP